MVSDMTALKINSARLPYRGEPTKDRKPVLTVPEGAVIVNVGIVRESVVQTKDWVGRNRKDLWADDMRAMAWNMIVDGKSIAEIAEAVGKTETATYQELCRIRREKGIRRAIVPITSKYTPEMDATIIRMHNAGCDYKAISKAIDKTPNAVKARIAIFRKRGLITRDNRKEK